jgi:hypothetical protein
MSRDTALRSTFAGKVDAFAASSHSANNSSAIASTFSIGYFPVRTVIRKSHSGRGNVILCSNSSSLHS